MMILSKNCNDNRIACILICIQYQLLCLGLSKDGRGGGECAENLEVLKASKNIPL